MAQANARAMICRLARDGGIKTEVGSHTFGATALRIVAMDFVLRPKECRDFRGRRVPLPSGR
jgi:hypothetical protein